MVAGKGDGGIMEKVAHRHTQTRVMTHRHTQTRVMAHRHTQTRVMAPIYSHFHVSIVPLCAPPCDQLDQERNQVAAGHGHPNQHPVCLHPGFEGATHYGSEGHGWRQEEASDVETIETLWEDCDSLVDTIWLSSIMETYTAPTRVN